MASGACVNSTYSGGICTKSQTGVGCLWCNRLCYCVQQAFFWRRTWSRQHSVTLSGRFAFKSSSFLMLLSYIESLTLLTRITRQESPSTVCARYIFTNAPGQANRHLFLATIASIFPLLAQLIHRIQSDSAGRILRKSSAPCCQ